MQIVIKFAYIYNYNIYILVLSINFRFITCIDLSFEENYLKVLTLGTLKQYNEKINIYNFFHNLVLGI